MNHSLFRELTIKAICRSWLMSILLVSIIIFGATTSTNAATLNSIATKQIHQQPQINQIDDKSQNNNLSTLNIDVNDNSLRLRHWINNLMTSEFMVKSESDESNGIHGRTFGRMKLIRQMLIPAAFTVGFMTAIILAIFATGIFNTFLLVSIKFMNILMIGGKLMLLGYKFLHHKHGDHQPTYYAQPYPIHTHQDAHSSAWHRLDNLIGTQPALSQSPLNLQQPSLPSPYMYFPVAVNAPYYQYPQLMNPFTEPIPSRSQSRALSNNMNEESKNNLKSSSTSFNSDKIKDKISKLSHEQMTTFIFQTLKQMPKHKTLNPLNENKLKLKISKLSNSEMTQFLIRATHLLNLKKHERKSL